MRPHVRVIPLIVAFVVAACALAAIPVDLNEQLCRENPTASVCDGPPEYVPWIARKMKHGY